MNNHKIYNYKVLSGLLCRIKNPIVALSAESLFILKINSAINIEHRSLKNIKETLAWLLKESRSHISKIGKDPSTPNVSKNGGESIQRKEKKLEKGVKHLQIILNTCKNSLVYFLARIIQIGEVAYHREDTCIFTKNSRIKSEKETVTHACYVGETNLCWGTLSPYIILTLIRRTMMIKTCVLSANDVIQLSILGD